MRTVVLGSSGMLGQAITGTLSSSGIPFVSVSRSSGLFWDALEAPFSMLSDSLSLGPSDWIVNCIGWIPQKATGVLEVDESQAFRLNSGLVREIYESQKMLGFRWIQIGTDCVFLGDSGSYSEESSLDAKDLYGRSKVSGEEFTGSSNQLRTSIVGKDVQLRSGLYEWFINLPLNAEIPGYTNHLWNGVSTLVFSRVALGLIQRDVSAPFRQHLVPKGHVSKYELLNIFRELTCRFDVKIIPTEAQQGVDRRLVTVNTELNDKLWHFAGYSGPQTVEEMCHDFIQSSKNEEH